MVDTRDSCARPLPVNSITVSKKRNWLNQRSMRPSPPSDEDDHTYPLQVRTLTQPQTCTRPHARGVSASDPAEDNDADDEGEIWYNPIPEDEEVKLCPGERGARAQRRTSAEEGGGASVTSRDSGNLNTNHSGEQKHVYRQMCRSQEEKVRPTGTGTGTGVSSSFPRSFSLHLNSFLGNLNQLVKHFTFSVCVHGRKCQCVCLAGIHFTCPVRVNVTSTGRR